jgi:hypothetical protein
MTLHIDTAFSLDDEERLDSPLQSPNAPFANDRRDSRARSLSQGLLPQLRLSVDKSPDRRNSGEGRNVASVGMEKARNESRKLLSHILAQLEARNIPPPLLEGSEARTPHSKRGIGSVVRSFSGKGKASDTKQTHSDEDSDEDYDPADRPVFFTDATLKLMLQLRDTLKLSAENKWDIFSAESAWFPIRSGSC